MTDDHTHSALKMMTPHFEALHGYHAAGPLKGKPKRPGAHGHLIHIAPNLDDEGNVRTPGFRVQCAGVMVPNPEYTAAMAVAVSAEAVEPSEEGATVSGIAPEILEKHTIGHFVRNPDAKDAAGNPIDYIALGNSSHDGHFVLDQPDFDFANPVCKVCGQPVSL